MSDLISRKAVMEELLAIQDVTYMSTCLTVDECKGKRWMIARAIDAVKDAPTVDVHAHWELRYEDIENDDGWQHNRCSHCKHDAVFYPTFSEDWDEDIDGEWVSLGVVQDGIEEFFTDFCPYCGAKMDEVSE